MIKKFNIPKNNEISFITNLAYGIIGLFIIQLTGWIGIPLALSMIYLMLGSGYYHFHSRHHYLWFDWSAMYMVFTTQIAVHLWYLFSDVPNITYIWGDAIFFGIVLSLAHNWIDKYKWFGINVPFFIIGALYTVIVVLSFFVLHWLYATISLIFFAVGFWLRSKGEKVYHHDEAYHDKLHGLWHILTAIGMLFYNLILV